MRANFADPLPFVQLSDPREGPPFLDFFLHDEMGVGHGGDLRQMGHADHLMVRGHLFELFTDDFRHPAADAGIDFVE